MAFISIKVSDNEDFVGLITIDKLDKEEEVIERKIESGLCVSDLLRKATNGECSLGSLEINLDFDDQGSLVQIELYS